MSESYKAVSDVKVSVCVVTYNQRNYIRECLDGLVNQEPNFKYEIIVGDDASTDGTAEIVAEYAVRFPGLIIPALHKKNLGPAGNYFHVHDMARGEYICHVDGDDLSLPGKLQKVSDILDSEPDVNIVFHRMKMRSGTSGKEINDLLDVERIGKHLFSRADLLTLGSIACHSSKTYRRQYRLTEKTTASLLDYFTDVEQVDDGYAYLLNEFLGVYRVGVGITQTGKTKLYYLQHLNYFLKKYPRYSSQIGANAFTSFLADVKNGRKTWRQSLALWLRCRSVKSIVIFFQTLHLRKIIRIPVIK